MTASLEIGKEKTDLPPVGSTPLGIPMGAEVAA